MLVKRGWSDAFLFYSVIAHHLSLPQPFRLGHLPRISSSATPSGEEILTPSFPLGKVYYDAFTLSSSNPCVWWDFKCWDAGPTSDERLGQDYVRLQVLKLFDLPIR